MEAFVRMALKQGYDSPGNGSFLNDDISTEL